MNCVGYNKLLFHERYTDLIHFKLFWQSVYLMHYKEKSLSVYNVSTTLSQYLCICNNEVHKLKNNAHKTSAYISTYFTTAHLLPTEYLDYSLGSEWVCWF